MRGLLNPPVDPTPADDESCDSMLGIPEPAGDDARRRSVFICGLSRTSFPPGVIRRRPALRRAYCTRTNLLRIRGHRPDCKNS